MNQEQQILEYMEINGSITTLEAFRKIGCARLSARIADLRGKGINIDTEMVAVRNRKGETKHVARYSLGED